MHRNGHLIVYTLAVHYSDRMVENQIWLPGPLNSFCLPMICFYFLLLLRMFVVPILLLKLDSLQN